MKKPSQSKMQSLEVRVQKVMADRGLCSRRQAEEIIAQGKVRVNGKTAVLGTKMNPNTDTLSITGHTVPQVQPQTLSLIMHKPKGVICSHGDPHHSRTIYDLLPKKYQEVRLFCAGRLDKDSEGLLILTNDGTLVQQLTHPSSGVTKRYHVTLHKPFDPSKIPLFLKGVEDEGEHLFATQVIPVDTGYESSCKIEIHLQQGRKREIRRLCESFGYYVKRLKRFQIGRLVLKKIPIGTVRLLTNKERELLLS